MRKSILVLPLLALAACTAGPDYRGPASAGAVSLPERFARATDIAGAETPAVAEWWKAMGDQVLDDLEEQALSGNADIGVAQARIRQARAMLRAERANTAPSVNAQALYAHATLPGIDLSSSDSSSDGGNSGNQSLNFYNLAFDASWEVDLWGGNRRGTEAARAQVDAAEADLADVQVALAAETAQAYVSLRDRQQRLVLGNQKFERQRQMLSLTEQRRAAGTATALDVEQQREQLERTKAGLLPLTADRDSYLNALAVLVGKAPGALDDLLAAPGAIPLPPATVPMPDPAAMVRRRPDIRAAERRYAAATAKIGVAEAQRFPTLSFMGLIGIGGTHPDDVLDSGNLAAIALPQLSWNFLDFGRNAARVEQARGKQDEAAAQYRASVLQALQDCEDSLTRYGSSRRAVESAKRSLASAQRTYALMQQRFTARTATRIALLDAESRQIAGAEALTQASAEMTARFIALQKAIGLGWK